MISDIEREGKGVKFSVLLPTRNGGKYLKDCISSILGEAYQNMELVVSDNANTDDTGTVLDSFRDDSRLKVVHLSSPVSVTENWNCALQASCGDYILMMGDDDCLLPRYFNRMEQILVKYNSPDCVTYNAYSYVSCGSINDNQQSYYNEMFFRFGSDFQKEGLIGAEMRFSIVRDMFRFSNRIPLNMQTTLVSRLAINQIPGAIFRAPFPDHFALNSLLLKANTWVYVPEKLLVVGVSPKSFGHFVYSDKQDEGKKYLGIDVQFDGCLPGLELNNCMVVWLSLLKSNYQDYLKDIEISRAGYVRRQVYSWYLQYKSGAISFRNLVSRLKLLTFIEWFYLFSVFTEKQSWLRLGSVFRSSKSRKIQSVWPEALPLENIATIKEFANWISCRSATVKEQI